MGEGAQYAPAGIVLFVLIFWGLVIHGRRTAARKKARAERVEDDSGVLKPQLVRIYVGNQQEAVEAYQRDAALLGVQGYEATSQSWVPGAYSGGAFLVALLLCLVVIGLLVFVYMLIVKPPGRLTVSYRLVTAGVAAAPDVKICPSCAEEVKRAAVKCRYCGYQFS